MRTVRIAIFGRSPCERCWANCCKQRGHEYSVLLEGDERRRFAPYAIDAPIRHEGRVVIEKVLPFVDGQCLFLGEEDRCLIYNDRQVNCRRFQCVAGYHRAGGDMTGHSVFLQRNPEVREMLEGWGRE